MSAIRSLPARTRSASHLGILREVTTNTDEQNDTADNYSDPEEVDIEVVNVRSFKECSGRDFLLVAIRICAGGGSISSSSSPYCVS